MYCHLYNAIKKTSQSECRKAVVYSLQFHPHFPSCVGIPASFFNCCLSAMSGPNFSLGFNFEVKNSQEKEGLDNKALMTDMEADVFVE